MLIFDPRCISFGLYSNRQYTYLLGSDDCEYEGEKRTRARIENNVEEEGTTLSTVSFINASCEVSIL